MSQAKWRSAMKRDLKLLITLFVLVMIPPAAYLLWDLGENKIFSFKSPWALLLLVAIPFAIWITLGLGNKRKPVLSFSSVGLLSRLKRGPFSLLSPLPAILRIVALLLIVLALTRPQTRDRGGRVEVDGIDIVLALDMSNSMEATDLIPNRLDAAKNVIDRFIRRRKSDRIGLVVFGKDAYTQCPLTLDYSVLRTMLAELKINMIDGTGTAIGNALGVSLARLRKSDAKSKVVILLTDGDNNAGNIMPKQAARYASAMKVKVFTILMGPAKDRVHRDALGRPIRIGRQYPVNPKLLEEIAAATGGKAYLATDRRALEERFERILGELDKTTRRDVASVFQDAYRPFVVIALLLLFFEALLRLTRLREFP